MKERKPSFPMDPAALEGTQVCAREVAPEMKGGPSPCTQNDVVNLLFVREHLPHVLALAEPENIDAAEKMDYRDNINS